MLGIEAVPDTTRPQSSSECRPLQQEVQKLQNELCISKQEVNNLQVEVGEYKRQIAAMQKEVAELRSSSVLPSHLQSQMQVALHPSNVLYSGPSSIERFHSFSVESAVAELKRLAPDVYRLIATLATTHRLDVEGEDREARLTDLRCVTSLSTLLKNRSMKVLGIQLLLSFMLIARATSKQVRECYNNTVLIDMYIHYNNYLYRLLLCSTMLEYVYLTGLLGIICRKKLTTEAMYIETIRHDHWVWVYDNFNMQERVRHEREGMHMCLYVTNM